MIIRYYNDSREINPVLNEETGELILRDEDALRLFSMIQHRYDMEDVIAYLERTSSDKNTLEQMLLLDYSFISEIADNFRELYEEDYSELDWAFQNAMITTLEGFDFSNSDSNDEVNTTVK